MADMREIRLRNIETGQTVAARTTAGGLLKATRLVGAWLKARQIEAEEPFMSFTWFYLAARHSGIEGTGGDAITLETVEEFFDRWDVLEDEEDEEGGEPAPFATAATSREP